jgi:hypothetical protein
MHEWKEKTLGYGYQNVTKIITRHDCTVKPKFLYLRYRGTLLPWKFTNDNAETGLSVLNRDFFLGTEIFFKLVNFRTSQTRDNKFSIVGFGVLVWFDITCGA